MRDGASSSWLTTARRSRGVGLMLVLALYLGAFTIPSERSVAGAVARLAFCAGSRGCCRRGEVVMVWRESDGSIQAAGIHDDGVRERIQALPDSLQSGVAQGYYFGPRRQDAAVWAPLWETTTHSFSGLYTGAAMTPSESAAYRAAMFDALAKAGWGGVLPPGLRTGDVSLSVFSRLGLASNVWGILCATGLAAWYAPVARFRRARAAHAAGVRHARGECIHCGYSRAGLPEAKCPECGIEQG